MNANATRLSGITRDLWGHWQQTKAYWRDAKCREFEEKYLADLTPQELERIVNLPYLGDIAIGKLFARMIIHLSGHVGEMSYIRGLKRGLNK
jgi:hypothetical protein